MGANFALLLTSFHYTIFLTIGFTPLKFSLQ